DEYQRLRAACQRDLDRLLGSAPGMAPASAPEIKYLPPHPPTSPTAARPIPATTPDVEIIEAEIVYNPPTQSWQSAPAASAPVHPLDKPEPEPLLADAAPAPAPGRAKRALADVLSGFMQERNIRWGELVSGLLIVGSAAGLTLSLRVQLSLWI